MIKTQVTKVQTQNKKLNLFSFTLFKQSIKSNWVLWMIFTLVLTSMMIIMCIAIPKNSRINTGGNIAPAILKMYYGQMTGFFIMIYTIITANSLIASQVDRGSMAYVLSTPIKRTTVIFTQMCYLISAIFIMILLVMLTNTICFIAQRSSKLVFNFGDIALMALGCFLLQVALASISFMASCIFNLSKYSFALGAGAPVGFYLLSTLSQISGLESLKYLTIFTLFNVGSAQDPTSNGWILDRDTLYITLSFCALAIISSICFTIGHIVFKKKDLPL